VEFNPALFLDPSVAHKMPAVNMGSSIVTAMPVMVNQVRSRLGRLVCALFVHLISANVAVICCAASGG
jgi:hypothetical protein